MMQDYPGNQALDDYGAWQDLDVHRRKSPPPAYYLSHRKRTDSPNRILYPLKRVDWEPGGDPAKINAQNRGVSQYKRITWEEAATLIAGEMKRVADKYGTEALAAVYSGGHDEGHNVAGSHGLQGTFMQWWALKEYGTPITNQEAPATSSSGGQLGGRYVLGTDYEPIDVLKDVAENADMILMWASRRRGQDVAVSDWPDAGHVVSLVRRAGHQARMPSART